jgi:hypothetical protein
MPVLDWSRASLPWFKELEVLKERIGGLFRRAEFIIGIPCAV